MPLAAVLVVAEPLVVVARQVFGQAKHLQELVVLVRDVVAQLDAVVLDSFGRVVHKHAIVMRLECTRWCCAEWCYHV